MENQCTRFNDEHNKLMKILNFRFPSRYKKIAFISAIVLFAVLLGSKFVGSDSTILKDVCRTMMLLALLVASLSRDAIEDEYIEHIRSQSFVLAFVCAVTYSIGLPLVAFVLDILITKITGDGNVNFHEVSAFEVMFMLICFQLLFFEAIKRYGRAQ